MNIVQLLHKSARSYPEKWALCLGLEKYARYGEFAEKVMSIGFYLREKKGIRVGDRVAMALPNSPFFYEFLFAVWHIGGVIVPMNAKLHLREWDYIATHSEANYLLLSEDNIEPFQRQQTSTCVVETPSIIMGSALEKEPYPAALRRPDDPAWIFYTSGTTGRPKGAVLTHRNLLVMTLSYFADIDQIKPEQTIIHAAPMSHGSGLYGLPHIAKAAMHVIPQSGGFQSDEFFQLLANYPEVTIFAAPTMVVRMMRSMNDETDTSNLRLICYGGGPMYVEDTRRALQVFGPKLVQIYGQGEAPMTIAALPRAAHLKLEDDEDWLSRLASVGLARTDVEIGVFDQNGKELGPLSIGEVAVRGDIVMSGYWNDPAATNAAIRNGWLFTGDMGFLDNKGFLFLKDRSKDLIISGGTNIYPREVEEILLRHEAIWEVAVIGEPDEEWGENVVAFYAVRDGYHVTTEDLDAHCLGQLARFKRPKKYIRLDDLPKNHYGKILKRSLREQL